MNELRSDYNKFYLYSTTNPELITPQMANEEYRKVMEQLSRADRGNDYAHIEQLSFYRAQYERLKQHYITAQQRGYSKYKNQSEIANIFQSKFRDTASVIHRQPQFIVDEQNPRPKMNSMNDMNNMLHTNNMNSGRELVLDRDNSGINNSHHVSNSRNNSGIIKSEKERDPILSFFADKSQQLARQHQKKVTFQTLLQNPSIHRSFRKKTNTSILKSHEFIEKQKYLQELRQRNQYLQRESDKFHRHASGAHNSQQDRSYLANVQRQIQTLEEQLRQTNFQNQQLRSEASQKNIIAYRHRDHDQISDSPYSIITRNNNIRVIDGDNYARSVYNYGPNNSPHYNREQQYNAYRFNDSNRYEGNLVQNEIDESRTQQYDLNLPIAPTYVSRNLNSPHSDRSNRRNRQARHSYKGINALNPSGNFNRAQQNRQSLLRGDYFQSYIKSDDLYYSRTNNLYRGISNEQTCSRNKVAFFKESLIIVKDQRYEIAYRRSQLNRQMDEQTVVFFIKNKTIDSCHVDIRYKNYSGDYRIDTNERVGQIASMQQGREVITVTLINHDRLESIIDAQLQFRDQSQNLVCSYEIWVPACFIKFDYKFRDEVDDLFDRSRPTSRSKSTYQRVKIKPDEQFRSYYHAVEAGLPLTNKSEHANTFQTSAWLYGQSKLYSGGLKLTWNDTKRSLTLEGTDKWTDWIGFLLYKYKGKI